MQSCGAKVIGLDILFSEPRPEHDERLREAVAVSARLHAGESAGDVRRSLRMPSKAAERFVADVARADQERLKEGLCVLADLELDLRGGGLCQGHGARHRAEADQSGSHETAGCQRACRATFRFPGGPEAGFPR